MNKIEMITKTCTIKLSLLPSQAKKLAAENEDQHNVSVHTLQWLMSLGCNGLMSPYIADWLTRFMNCSSPLKL